jgi:Sortase domain
VKSPLRAWGREERHRTAALLGLAAVTGAVGLAAFALAIGTIDSAPRAPQPPLTVPAPESATVTLPHVKAPRAARRPAPPRQIAIPRIGLRARIVRVGLTRDRALEVPADARLTGWWSGGARPGEPGPAVIDGHVDTSTGPAVFFRVGALRKGDAIRIRLADGRTVRFAVRRVARYPKARFPTREVYGATKRPTLRLITCSGAFDRSSGHYLDNTVVYASLAA